MVVVIDARMAYDEVWLDEIELLWFPFDDLLDQDLNFWAISKS